MNRHRKLAKRCKELEKKRGDMLITIGVGGLITIQQGSVVRKYGCCQMNDALLAIKHYYDARDEYAKGKLTVRMVKSSAMKRYFDDLDQPAPSPPR